MNVRELKFRVWTGKKMLVPDGLCVDSKSGSFKPTYSDDWGMSYGGGNPVVRRYSDACCLMQFIGLQDINGKDIYEGDVLHQLDPVIWNPFTVEYCADSGCYLCGGTLSSRVIKQQELVIVGNIYENPNILNGEL